MSSELSPYAIHRIICFVETENCRSRKVKKTSTAPTKRHLRKVDAKWNYVYTNYFLDDNPPPMDYLRSLELALFLSNDLDGGAMRSAFGHGEPLVFDRDLPRLLLPAIVEAFQQLKEAPSLIDVTFGGSFEDMDIDASAVWPQVYIDYLPCRVWTTADDPGKANKEKPQEGNTDKGSASSLVDAEAARFVVEEFRIPSKHFDKQLTVELHFALGGPRKHSDADATFLRLSMPAIEKTGLQRVAIRLVDGVGNGSTTAVVARKSKSVLLISDVASEVYGFVDRVHVGTSLIANRGLKKLILNLRHRLPVHHLMCEFEPEAVRRRPSRQVQATGNYWLVLHCFHGTYSDVRRFKIHSTAGAVDDCALIRRYLSNCHVADLQPPCSDSRFYLKMLAALVDRNFSVDRLRMRAPDGPLTDFRSMDAVFGGRMRLGALHLWSHEECLARLVKTTDLLRLPAVQRLTELKLMLENPKYERERPEKSLTRRQRAVVSSPLWIGGVHLLRNCAYYEVNYKYEPDRPMKTIPFKLVQICEKFERGEITEICGHFKFAAPRRLVPFPFDDRNRIASLKSRIGEGFHATKCTRDVYRFRNAATGEWLTACVGHITGNYHPVVSVLHIVKGEVDPDATDVIGF